MSGLPAVRLDAFEGPFDLLLELSAKNKIDLRDVSLAEIAADFLRFISLKSVSPAVQGDFLVVAATLLLGKARASLAQDSSEEVEEESTLREHLRIYEAYRQKSEQFAQVWSSRPLLSAGTCQTHTSPKSNLPEIDPTNLRDVFRSVIASLPGPLQPTAHLTLYGRSLDECLEIFRKRLKTMERVVFQEAVMGVPAHEVAVSLLAVLELVKTGQADLEQESPFACLHVRGLYE